MQFAKSGYISTPELQLAAGYRKPPTELEPPHWTHPDAPDRFRELVSWFEAEGIDVYSGVSVYLSRRYGVDLDRADKIITKFGGSPGLLQAQPSP